LSIYRGTRWEQASPGRNRQGQPESRSVPWRLTAAREEADQPGPGSGSMGKFFEPVAEDAILLQRDAELFGFRILALPSGQQ
jgi:hypothetical protein